MKTDLLTLAQNFERLNVLVIGDAMLDCYLRGRLTGYHKKRRWRLSTLNVACVRPVVQRMRR